MMRRSRGCRSPCHRQGDPASAGQTLIGHRDGRAPLRESVGRLDLKIDQDDALKVFGEMSGMLTPSLKVSKPLSNAPNAVFLFGGYSWVKKCFELWTISYSKAQGCFKADPASWLHFWPSLKKIVGKTKETHDHLHAVRIEKEHGPVRTPILLAQLLDFNVGISSADLNAIREVRKFRFECLKLCGSRCAALNKDIAIEAGLCLQGQTCGAVKEFLWLSLGQIGQQQCLRGFLVGVSSPSVTISSARESIDIAFFEWMLLRGFVLQCRRVAAEIFGDQFEFRGRPTPAKLMAFPGRVSVSSLGHADPLPEKTLPASRRPPPRALVALSRYDRIKPTTTP